MKSQLHNLTAKISSEELQTHDEIRREFLNVIEEYLEEEWGLLASVKMERDVGEGYYDAKIGSLYLEIKRPSDGLQAGIDDAQEYIRDEGKSGVDFFTTEGTRGAHINDNNTVLAEDDLPDLAPRLQTLLDNSVSNPSPEDIIDAFGPRSQRVRTFIESLWEIFQEHEDMDRVDSAFDAWKKIYAESANLSSDARKAVNRQAREYGIDISTKEETYAFLFVLQTYFAIFLKLFSARLAGEYDSLDGRLSRGLWPDSYRQLSVETEIVEHDLFDWFIDPARESGEASAVLEDIVNRLARSVDIIDVQKIDRDILRELYQSSFDSTTRKAMGEFYTNDELVNEVLDKVGYSGEKILDEDALIVDPTCGSGTFLFQALQRFISEAEKKGKSDREIVSDAESNIRGIDLHPFAVAMARTNYLLALGERAEYIDEVPIFWTDSLAPSENTMKGENITVATLGTVEIPDPADIKHRDVFSALEKALAGGWSKDRYIGEFGQKNEQKYQRTLSELFEFFKNEVHNGMWVPAFRGLAGVREMEGNVEYLVGNPPWVRHKNVASKLRERLKRSFDYYDEPWRPDLNEMRNPQSPRDYSMAFVEAGFDYLSDGGTLGLVITDSVFRGLYAAEARKDLAQNKNLTHIVDYAISPRELFPDAVTTPLVFAAEDSEPQGDVEIQMYNREDDVLNWQIEVSDLPLDKNDPRSPWFLAPPEVIEVLREMQQKGPRLGDLFKPTSGAKTAANDVYYVRSISPTDNSEHVVIETEGDEVERIEKELIRPMVRGKNVKEWGFETETLHLWTHGDNGDPLATLPDKASDYFENHQKRLEGRSDYIVKSRIEAGAPYWVIGNVKDELFGEKIAWKEIAKTVESTYLPSTISYSAGDVDLGEVDLIPNNKVYFFSVEDKPNVAKALTALLNSAPVRAYAGSYAMRTGGNYIQNQSWVLGLVPVPSELPAGNVDRLDDLSESRQSGDDSEEIEDDINNAVAELYDISEDQENAVDEFLEFFLAG